MNVPFVDLKSQYYSIKDEISVAIQTVIDNTAFVGGKNFEPEFAAYCHAKHCVGVGNGTDALYIALTTFGIGTGDEVITAANTFIATSEAITGTGAKVVFVDCDDRTYNIDVSKIEAVITDKTKAIVPVHLYGQPAEMDEINRIAKKYNLFVIEDAAQAHGATYKGKITGTLGDCACFSFYPGKNLGAYGDAGAIVLSDDEKANYARMYANHGRSDKYNHKFEAVNSRMDGIQAAVLSVKLKYLDSWNDRRRYTASRYNQGLKDVVAVPYVIDDVKHVYHLYVIRVKDRDKVIKQLAEKGIATGIHYPIPLPFLDAYKYLNHSKEDFPVAYAYQNELLSLPMCGDLTDDQIDYVIENVCNIVKNN